MGPTPKEDDRSGCLGRSRGGLTTEAHALVGRQRPAHLAQAFRRPGSQRALGRGHAGHPQSWRHPADRPGLCSDELRQTLADRDTWANVKPMPIAITSRPSQASCTATGTRSSGSSQDQSLPRRRNPLRQEPPELPRRRQASLSAIRMRANEPMPQSGCVTASARLAT